MSWINKLTYYPNGKVPEDPNNENPDATSGGTSYEIGTTFDKVFYKNKEGTVTNFSLISFIDIIKEFFSKKGFMIWGKDTPENNSNIVEWYQTQIIRDPVLFKLKIEQLYNENEEQQPGYYELIGDSDSPKFSNGEQNFNFSITTNEDNNSNIYLDPDCMPRSGTGSTDNDYYYYTLKSKILGITTSYRLRIQITLADTDLEADRNITVIQVQDNGWKTLDDNSNLTFNLTKYYTITFVQPDENNNDINDNIIEILYVISNTSISDNEWPNPPEKDGFNAYWSIEKNGSKYSSDTAITNDLTLYAVYTEVTSESSDEPTPENLDETSQG